MNKTLLLLILSLFFVSTIPYPVSAQEEKPGPVYIIQSGDTLWSVAIKFEVGINELVEANPDVNPDLLSIGQELVIPGLEDVSGYLITEVVPFGDSLRSLRRKYQIDDSLLRRLNKLISPTELYAGASLIIPQESSTPLRRIRTHLKTGESALELAVRQSSNLWELTSVNQVGSPISLLPGDTLYSQTGPESALPSGLPAAFSAITVSTLPITQGDTVAIRVIAPKAESLSGLLVDMPLRFFPLGNSTFLALQGVHALTVPGGYPLRIEANMPDGSQQAYEQMILVMDGNFLKDPILVVDPITINPEETEPEHQQVVALTSFVTPERYWSGIFANPSFFKECFTSLYGNRREYRSTDGSFTLFGFHSGLDFCGGVGVPITAPADGVVVFADHLTVRGGSTIIDHGWGVFSGFWHQDTIEVKVGDVVSTGQRIGTIGSTGRVTGPHMHWEIWVNGIQVNPMDWLRQDFSE